MVMTEGTFGISKFIPGAWAKPCDTCHTSTATLYCKIHSLFLCMACDTNLHAPHVHHERVFLCDVCEHAPAIVTCKADMAALCAACDRDIHTANPLARRHDRVPVVPFFGDVVFPAAGTKLEPDEPEMKSMDFLFSDADQFLEFDCSRTSDSVVPVQTYEEATAQQIMHQLSDKYLEIDFTNSKINSVNHNNSFAAQSISQSISSSSIDVGIVPEGSSMSDISNPYIRTNGVTVDPSGSIGTVAAQGSDREARVMRYKEKRKNRKFEKTIRYASRKAYAEKRPRIKGRFAKRTEMEPDSMNRMFASNSSAAFLSDTTGYGIVPSF